MSRSALYSIEYDHPIPAEVWMPRGVRAAATEARDLYARHQQEIGTILSLRDRAQEADRADRAAYRHAAATGEQAPEPTEPAIREEIAEAERRAEGIEGALRDALVAQAQAVAACHDEWTAHIRADLAGRASKIVATLDQLGAGLAELEAEARIARTLDEFDGHPRSLQIRPLDTAREQRSRTRAAEVESQRRGRGVVDFTRHALVAALQRLASGHLQADTPGAGDPAPGVTEGAAAGYPHALTV
jgi:hypothetical protein